MNSPNHLLALGLVMASATAVFAACGESVATECSQGERCSDAGLASERDAEIREGDAEATAADADASEVDANSTEAQCVLMAGCYRITITSDRADSAVSQCASPDSDTYRQLAEQFGADRGAGECDQPGAIVSTDGTVRAQCQFVTSCGYQNLGRRVETRIEGDTMTSTITSKVDGVDACVTTEIVEKADSVNCNAR